MPNWQLLGVELPPSAEPQTHATDPVPKFNHGPSISEAECVAF